MKNSKIIIAFLIGMTAMQAANAQDKSEKIQLRPFGVGLHIEQFRAGEVFNQDLVSPANNIILTANIKNVFRIEPEFGYASYSNDDEDIENKASKLGLGLYGMFQKGNLNIYAGLHIEYISVKSTHSTGFGPPQETKETAFGFGPVLGGEYFLSRHFSFGGNVMYLFSSLKLTNDDGFEAEEEEKASVQYTATGLLLKFYF